MNKIKALNILVIVESIDAENSSGSKANIALINNLKEAGHNLKVYHYSRKEIHLKGIECINIPENRKSVLFFLSRMERYARYYLKLKLSRSLETYFGFSFTLFNDRNSIAKVLSKKDDFTPDLVFTLSQGGSFRPHHALLKIPEFHPKWIAYIHDPYPMHWYPKPYTWKEAGFAQKENFMKQIADRCKLVAFPSQLLMEWMGNQYEPFHKKGIVIPHQIDSSRELPKLEGNFDLAENMFTVLHAGNLLQARSPRSLVEGFIKFKNVHPDFPAQLILLGPAPHFKEYLKEQSELNSFIKVISENRPFQEVLALQNKVDVNIIIEAKAAFSPFLPGKFPHCIQAERPILVLGPEKSEVRRLLGNTYPYWTTIDNPIKIAEILSELYINWKNGNDQFIREDLKQYLSEAYLKQVIDSIPLSS